MYRNLFIDLDDTLWAFSENAEDTFREVYDRYGFHRYFDSFHQFYSIYRKRNVELWDDYGNGLITKDELNRQRFSYPLLQVGVEDEDLVTAYSADFFSIIPTRSKLMPHAREALELLVPHFRLYVLSNGFRELQERKMRSAGIDRYFEKVILSEDIGLHKPHPAIFHFALSATQSLLTESLMIGDSWKADVEGAKGVGMHQLFYDWSGAGETPFLPTFRMQDWAEAGRILL